MLSPQEREKSVSNMEYLKNVVYKFLTLPPCDEKSHLIPVLDTMLRLSKEERATIEALASGMLMIFDVDSML